MPIWLAEAGKKGLTKVYGSVVNAPNLNSILNSAVILRCYLGSGGAVIWSARFRAVERRIAHHYTARRGRPLCLLV